MPNLYFWEPENQTHGILHAVLPWDECDRVINRALATRLGDEFPSRTNNGNTHGTLAILYVRSEEANEQWTAGFYRIDSDVTEIRNGLSAAKESRPTPVRK
jgi:hypothetical protein